MGHDPRLTVLGSGTAVPRAGRATSCYLVEDGSGGALLVDLGPGALARAADHGCDLRVLDAVLLTHIHPDHCADLVALQFALRNPLVSRERPPVVVCGHEAVALLLSRLRNAWPGWLAPGDRRLRFQAVVPGPLALPGATRATAFRVAHSEASLGYRLTLPNGFVLALSGDATEGEELLALGREADLFVLEAAVPEALPVPGHLTPRRAGRLAARCRPRHLLLTHFYPPVLDEPIEAQVREGFEGRVTLAQDGMVVPLTR